MFRFLRATRKRLLRKKRIGKYLTYASGEIVLVVLGILIALQLNNWREQAKNRETECTYLASLGQDLKRQLESVDAQIDFESDVIAEAELMMAAYYEAERFVVDDTFTHSINTLNNRRTFRTSSSTYQELLSTGSMSIISSESLKNGLMNYYQTMQRHEQVITRNNAFLDNNFVPLMFDLAPHETPEYQIGIYQDIIARGLVDRSLIDRDIKDTVFYASVERLLSEPLAEMGLLNRVEYRHRASAVNLSLMFELGELTNELLYTVDANSQTLCE